MGTTEGMGATWVGEAVGRARPEVFFKTSSNCSTSMMATVMVDLGTGIDSSPVDWKSWEKRLEAAGYKERSC